jgi:hypothetical protein
MVLLTLIAVALLLFACIHWRNGWCLFVAIPCVLAFFLPEMCSNYKPVSDVDLSQIAYSPETFQTCRELGWTAAVAFVLVAYGIPVLVWYNSAAFPVLPAVLVQVSLTLLVWAHLLLLRVFGPLKSQP